jgi:sigma-B regulation protein RsbU (phosphoserine phosphatase)
MISPVSDGIIKTFEFQENGLLLGFRSDEKYTNTPIRLAAGDRILMCTDGLLEAANPTGELFGRERLKEFMASHSRLPAQRFADALLQDLVSWSGRKAGSPQEDDLTLIVADID